jgi:hypothetical protein
MASTVIAVAALFLSFATFVVNQRWDQRAERRGRMPVLVFRDRDESEVTVANIGSAPAMNIIFAQGRPVDASDKPIALRDGAPESWFSPIHLRPLEPDGVVTVDCWMKHGLGLTFTDVFDNKYAVKANDYGMRLFEGSGHLPDWSMRDDAKYIDELTADEQDGLRRGLPAGEWATRRT